MQMHKPAKWIVGTLLAGAALPAFAEQTTQSEMDALKARIAQLEAKEQQSWLNERRAEEVKGLIREVLADADTRATLLQEGVMAGISDKGKIFLQSADGSFKMNIGGQIQFRWVLDWQQDSDLTGDDDYEAGFQIRRTKLAFDGHIASPKLTYEIVLAGAREDGTVEIEDVKIGYEFDNGLALDIGKFKIPFLREELLSSKRQLAVDRSSVTEFFTLDRSEQIQVSYETDMFKVAASLNDGADEEFSTIGDDPVDFAVAVRGDLKLAGDWKQMADITSWPGEEMGLFLGGAAFYQDGQEGASDGSSDADSNYFGWTIDGQFETNGLSLMAALNGGHILESADDRDMYGFLIQGGFHVSEELEPFARFEWLDADEAGADELYIVTVGVNYYFKKHNAKWTTDVVLILDGDNPGSNPFGNNEFGDGLGFTGFSSADDDIYVALRSQFQLLF